MLNPGSHKISETSTTELRNLTGVPLTTRCWTSISEQSYIAVTGHFVNSTGELKTVLLDCMEYSDSHTADNLAGELNKIVALWGLQDKIVAGVSDSAANIDATVRIYG